MTLPKRKKKKKQGKKTNTNKIERTKSRTGHTHTHEKKNPVDNKFQCCINVHVLLSFHVRCDVVVEN